MVHSNFDHHHNWWHLLYLVHNKTSGLFGPNNFNILLFSNSYILRGRGKMFQHQHGDSVSIKTAPWWFGLLVWMRRKSNRFFQRFFSSFSQIDVGCTSPLQMVPECSWRAKGRSYLFLFALKTKTTKTQLNIHWY